MKKLVFMIFVLATVLAACKKGDPGPQGIQGIQGEAGPAGADGSVILSGTAAPTATDGKLGDYYLDKTSSLLYGPKTDSGWGTGLSLKGSTGDAGAAGSQILTGSGAPDVALGIAGDYYLDTSSYLLYGPKTTDWGAGLQLGAPCETYLITNPYDYVSSYPYGQFRVYFTDFNYDNAKAATSLSLVYVNRSSTWHLAIGSVGWTTIWFNARFNFDVTSLALFLYLQQTSGVNWPDQNTFETGTAIDAIKIVVVPPGLVSTISALKDKSYDNVMQALSK